MRKLFLNSALVLVSVVLTLLVMEGVARLLIAPRSSGTGMGILHETFREESGADHGLIPPTQPADDGDNPRHSILFLGDSITNGHGVLSGRAFPAIGGALLGSAWRVLSMGVNGDDTRGEAARLSDTLDRLRSPVDYVVHQYVGNDIQGLVPVQVRLPGGWLAGLLRRASEVSYLADYLYQPWFMRAIGDGPIRTLLAGYADRAVMAAHQADLRALWARAHDDGARVVFVIFPLTFSQEFVDLSKGAYEDPLTDAFARSCRPGDGVLDVARLMASADDGGEGLAHWVVNPVDAHPSAALHALVGRAVADFIRDGDGPVVGCGALTGTPETPEPAPQGADGGEISL